ncbi:MAG TPA: DUF3466 family protein [Verrucomicrobiae bacterium]|nr:DUF3466 family protein [Verrucomicrobiae bacterium]
MKSSILPLVLLGALAAVPSLPAQTFNIPWHTIGPGGPSAGGVFAVSGGVDQSDAGQMSGGDLTLAGGFWVFPAAQPVATVEYTVVELGPLDGAASVASAVNNSGQIVGYANTTSNTFYHAAFWSNGGNTSLDQGSFDGDNAAAVGLNNSNQIVGYAYLAGNTVSHAAVWANHDGGPIDLGSLGGSSVASSVNNSGQIVGYSATPTNWQRALFWPNANSPALPLGSFGGLYDEAFAINDSGQIVGDASAAGTGSRRAALWNNSSSAPRDLGTLGLEQSTAWAINKSGQIVGAAAQYTVSFQVLPIFWANGSSAPVPLATLGGNVGAALGLNSSGRIVGYSTATVNGPSHAVLWDNSASPATDLNTLLPANSGWVLQSAKAINDSGEIVGYGTVGGGPEQHAFALIPASSTLRITSVTSAGSVLQIHFTSLPGHTYNILSTSDLFSGPWSTLQTGVSGTGGLVQVQVPIIRGTASSRQFFRIQQAQ